MAFVQQTTNKLVSDFFFLSSTCVYFSTHKTSNKQWEKKRKMIWKMDKEMEKTDLWTSLCMYVMWMCMRLIYFNAKNSFFFICAFWAIIFWFLVLVFGCCFFFLIFFLYLVGLHHSVIGLMPYFIHIATVHQHEQTKKKKKGWKKN